MARATKCRRQPLGAGGRTPPPAQALACGRICRRSPQVRRTADATAARCRSVGRRMPPPRATRVREVERGASASACPASESSASATVSACRGYRRRRCRSAWARECEAASRRGFSRYGGKAEA
uniref:Uncharacterized protein n=1 Tax=Setaria italica TaxID=4555 RepID=K3Y012_SETIT